MANTYHQIYIHVVFAVKYRNAVINNTWKSQLQSVIGNIINENDCKTIIVNGANDHIHCFFGLKPSVSLSVVIKNIKAKSSKYINDLNLTPSRFEWQRGYGAFSYSKSHIQNVYSYIENQEEHHRIKTFKEEYVDFLKKFEIDYDENYIFDQLN